MAVNLKLLIGQIVGMFVVFALALFLAWLVLMPLDAVRFHWSQMPGWLQLVGALLQSRSASPSWWSTLFRSW
jgi:hypothetical protein